MTQIINSTNSEVLVAIDIAKMKHNILVELPNGKRVLVN